MKRLPSSAILQTALLIIVLAAFGGCRPAQDHNKNQPTEPPDASRPVDTAFWIWNRSEPLTESELTQLKTASVHRVYWQIAELEVREGRLTAKNRWPLPAPPPHLEIVPVIRLEPTIRDPSLIDPVSLAGWAKAAGVTGAIQFDYDCPNRLLSAYARLLHDFRDAFGPVRLSTTALGDWCHADQWPDLEAAADAVYPMLYDVLPERTQATPRPDHARPIVDADYLSGLLQKWDAATSIPWRAGLPNFTRLSIFRNGEPKGHLRSWSIRDLLQNPALTFDGNDTAGPGVSLFKATSATRIGEVALQPNDWLCLRRCDRAELRSVVDAIVRHTSAQGIVWFQMPRPGLASSGWSIGEIAGQFEGTPQLTASIQANRLTLTNSGNADLPPRFDKGHTLTLSWSRPILREFVPGDFGAPEFLRDDQSVPAVAATTLRIRFPGLPAGKSLATGLVLFREDEIPLAIRYRIDENDWLELSSEP